MNGNQGSKAVTVTYETEHDLQEALFDWAQWRGNQEPALKLMFAIPNGQYRPGQRPEAGLTAGVPDIFLPVPRGKWHGLFIELKLPGGRAEAEQLEWIKALRDEGYRAAIAYGFEAAQHCIERYLAEEAAPA